MIFSSIDQHRDRWPVRVQCKVLGVSPSGFYAWHNRRPSKRAVANQNLLGHICRIHWNSRKLYGSPRVHAACLPHSIRVMCKTASTARDKGTVIWTA
jgi:putative transposase